MKLTNHVLYWRFAKEFIDNDHGLLQDIISTDIAHQKRRALQAGLYVTDMQKIQFYEQDRDNVVRNLITGVAHCNAYYLPRFLSQHKLIKCQKHPKKRKPVSVTLHRQRSPNRRRN